MTRTLRSTLVVGMRQNVTGPAARAAAALKHLHAVGQMPIGARIDRNARQLRKSTRQLSSSAMPIGIVGGLLLRNAYIFDKTMSKIAMISDQVNVPLSEQKEKIAELRSEIVRLARENPKVRKEIAEGALEFITAGNSIDRTIASLESLTKGAIGAMQHVGKTGKDVTDVVAAYFGNIRDPELYGKKVQRTLDIMSVGASTANHTWQEQSLAMQYTTPVARALGIEFKTLTAMLGVLADNGFKGEKGGSALRTILLKLRAPTKQAREAFDELGINIDRAFKFNENAAFSSDRLVTRLSSRFGKQGKAVGKIIKSAFADTSMHGDIGEMRRVLIARLSDVMNIDKSDLLGRTALASAIDAHFQSATEHIDFEYLFTKLGKANTAQWKKIAGVRRAPQALAIAKGYDGQFKPKLERINAQFEGATLRRVEKYLDSFAGKVDQFTSKLDGFADTLERIALVPLFKDIAIALGEMTDSLEAADPRFLKFGMYALGATAILAPLGFIISGVTSVLTFLASAASLSALSVGYLGKGLGISLLAAGRFSKALMMGPFIAMRKLRREMIIMNAAAAAGLFSRRQRIGRGVLGLLTGGFRGIAGALKAVSIAALSLAAISWPVVLGATAIAAVIGYWDELGAFFKGFFSEIDNAFADAGLGRPLQALSELASGLKSAIGDAVGYVKELLGFGGTGDTFAWMEAGKATARALAKAIKALLSPIKSAYNKLKNLLGLSAGSVKQGTGTNIEARARGGPVRAGQTYLVGERGPELASFPRNGFVTSNDKLRGIGAGSKSVSIGNINVNIHANGPLSNAKQIGQQIGEEVRKYVNDQFTDGAFA